MSETPQLPPGLRNNIVSMRYLLLGFALSWLPLPASGLAVIPLVLSFFYGVRFVRDLQRTGQRKALLPNMIGLAITAMLIAMLATPLVQYERTRDYQECLWGANTQQAQQSCQDSFDQHPGGVQTFLFG